MSTHRQPSNHPATILIVDDIEANRNVLKSLVESLGHSALLAENGLSALSKLETEAADLILLDILMPEMDGYEVLQHLKSNPQTQNIPVVMVSAVDEMDSVVQSIEQGADDYLIKPFNRTLLRARVRALLEKKRLRDNEELHRRELAAYNLKLEARVQEQTRELEAAYARLSVLDRAKDDFLRLIAREIQVPLNALIGPVELLFRGGLDEQAIDRLKQSFREASDNLQEVVQYAKLLTEIQLVTEKTLWLRANPLHSILAQSKEQVMALAEAKKIKLLIPDDPKIFVLSNMEWLTKSLSGLLRAAIELTLPSSEVRIVCENSDKHVCLNIHANGPNLPEPALRNFFSLFSEDGPIAGCGLEAAVAERIIVLCGGSVSIKNLEPHGVGFSLLLKRTDVPLHNAATENNLLESVNP
jgi:two-component system, sensor histidine kinase and response regulator